MSIGPTYGAPLGAIPPDMHSSWPSVREMLAEVFFDLNRAWVRDYLFKPDPQVQAAVLLSPDSARSLGFTQRIVADTAERHAFDKFMVGLVAPSGRKEGLGTAVMAESYSGPGMLNCRNDRVLQVISDPRARTVVRASVDDVRNVVEVSYSKTTGTAAGDQERLFVLATFHGDQFFHAIRHDNNTDSDSVDLDGIQQALITTVAGSRTNSSSRVPPASMVIPKTNDSGKMDSVGALFPGRKRIAVGDWYSRNIFAAYAHGTPVFSAMGASVNSRQFGCPHGAVEEMKRFALQDRLARVQLTIPPNLSISLDDGTDFLNELLDSAAVTNTPRDDASSTYCDSNSNSATIVLSAISTSISKVQRLRIAPAPTKTTSTIASSANSTETELSYAQKADLEYAAKMERKRERNRIAAKKSNAKKRAARQKRLEGLG